MVTLIQFRERSKLRHDFGDQIQVRYQYGDGEPIETWVSGSEVVQRLHSRASEAQLRALSRLDMDTLKIVLDSLPEMAKNLSRRAIRDQLAAYLQDELGGNIIGESLVDAVRGRRLQPDPGISEHQRWQALLAYEPFRNMTLELAWIQLEGSFTEEESTETDDWL